MNNTTTTTYTFTPTAGQCATTTTLTITVNPILSPTINCGVSTTSAVTFNWAAVSGATGYSVSYQVNAGPVVNVGAIGNVLSYQVTGLTGGDNVTITVTPTGPAALLLQLQLVLQLHVPHQQPASVMQVRSVLILLHRNQLL